MRRKISKDLLRSKADWKKVNTNMHGALEPASLQLTYWKGAAHGSELFELPENLRGVNSASVRDFVKQHKISNIMVCGHMEYPDSEDRHGYIDYEIDEKGMDIILYRVLGKPEEKNVKVVIEEEHYFNGHDNKWMYPELVEIVELSGLKARRVA